MADPRWGDSGIHRWGDPSAESYQTGWEPIPTGWDTSPTGRETSTTGWDTTATGWESWDRGAAGGNPGDAAWDTSTSGWDTSGWDIGRDSKANPGNSNMMNTTYPPPSESFALNAYSADTMAADDEYDLSEPSDSVYANQISMTEYELQSKQFTKTEVENLLRSPEYQRKINTCSSCWCNWLEGQFNDVCLECGGFALTRTCPICVGKCGKLWKRDLEMSHTHSEAHWNGACGLSEEKQKLHMIHLFNDGGDEDSITEAMKDLATG